MASTSIHTSCSATPSGIGATDSSKTMKRSACVEVERLQQQIRLMDSLSQEGFGQIKSLASIALLSLETPQGAIDTEALAGLLACIVSRAEDVEGCINSEAESVGCHHVDSSMERRISARTLARARMPACGPLREHG